MSTQLEPIKVNYSWSRLQFVRKRTETSFTQSELSNEYPLDQ